ncbi:MAG: hypothetical protein PHN69_07195 [Candidatus Pacebacteria bacterium]|nr:hypothetical protein [Candidatus Paceibacterota bacterium]
MKIVAKKVLVRSTLLEETFMQILFEKDGKVFEGALFFEKDDDNVELEVVKQEEIEADSDKELMEKVITFYMENATKTFESTARSMRHWQFMNGFTSTILR